jgi:hypothetical protein
LAADADLHLASADGLALAPDRAGGWRLRWGEPDWLGPVSLRVAGRDAPLELERAQPTRGADDLGEWRGLDLAWRGLPWPLATSVRAYRGEPLLVFRTEAVAEILGLATGDFARPAVAWPHFSPTRRRAGGAPGGARGYGHQYTEFAFATLSDDSLARFFLFPHRPAVVMPLSLNAPDGRSLLLAPLDAFHEQVIAVPRAPERAGEGIACGWHGDLAGAPAGFASELAVWAGAGPRGVLERFGRALRDRHRTQRLSRYADPLLSRVSYWTDNGAAYWYRTEPGRSVAETLEAVAAGLREREVPVGAFELDSWFYPHEVPRELNADARSVPPTGALRWEPRADVLPDGIQALRTRLGDPPLVTHARHWSSRSPLFETEPAWRDGDRAHPRDPEFFARLVERAAGWGVCTLEQDWLVEMFLGVRGLRERPGRTRAWQAAMDRAAARHGVTLLWCMATPADFLATLELARLASIRTSGDYRYLGDSPALWVRFLYTNALARALGLLPFKDVFLTDATATGLDGDPHAEAEALLAALSAGPVGIGDRVGRTDRELVMRTCRADGVLVKPDVPVAALDRCLRADCFFEPELLIGECWSDHAAGRTSYVAAFNAWKERRPLSARVPLAELGEAAPRGPVVCLDWRTRACRRLEPGDALELGLAASAWSLHTLCPMLPGQVAVFGDLRRYASLGDRRLRELRAERGATLCEVVGAPGERVEISGWSAGALAAERCRPGGAPRPVPRDAAGRFAVVLELDADGRAELRLTPD